MNNLHASSINHKIKATKRIKIVIFIKNTKRLLGNNYGHQKLWISYLYEKARIRNVFELDYRIDKNKRKIKTTMQQTDTFRK